MNSELLQQITDSIQSKIGEENSALISDDLGKLITANTQTLDQLDKMSKNIESLKDRNEKLVIANGNLLQQVPMSYETKKAPNSEDSEEKKKSFSFRDCFDSKGNFKK